MYSTYILIDRPGWQRVVFNSEVQGIKTRGQKTKVGDKMVVEERIQLNL